MEIKAAIEAAASLPGEGQAIWFRNNRITFKATAATTGGALALWEALAPPGDSPPLHIHHAEEEYFYVIEGRMRFRCGDLVVSGGPGTLVTLPRGIPHSFLVEGPEPARFLGMLTPAGGEQFFVEGGRPAETDGLPPETPPDIEPLKRLAARHGQEIVGPPMRLDDHL